MDNKNNHPIINLPRPSTRRIALRVSKSAERAIKAGHPWLFDKAILKQSHDGYPGDLAVIFDHKRKFLAIGLYDPHSPIRVRILQHNKPKTINLNWLESKIQTAINIRSTIPNHTNGLRLVHGENDGLPGLVIDKYHATGVIKLYTSAWVPYLDDILQVIKNLLAPERVILRLSRDTKAHLENLSMSAEGALLFGTRSLEPITFTENGLHFEVDPFLGQKTGFFLDQRDNRSRLGNYTNSKSVLNVFAYSGSFSVYAARGGAISVTSIDRSKQALAAAERNMVRNESHQNIANVNHQILVGDAFQTLNDLAEVNNQFDIVILDPPSFAQKRSQVGQAIATYEHLTRLGLKVLKSGGLLVQSSCSSRVDSAEFYDTIHRGAANTGRRLKEIERTSHPVDHPIGFPEGAYLKCLFAIVNG